MGIFFHEVDDDYEEDTFFDHYDVETPDTAFNLNLKAALFGTEAVPASFNMYAYEGSLTTPPCSEVVNWFVLMDPLPIKRQHLTAIQNIFENSKV